MAVEACHGFGFGQALILILYKAFSIAFSPAI
jgi:hypothetical protein